MVRTDGKYTTQHAYNDIIVIASNFWPHLLHYTLSPTMNGSVCIMENLGMQLYIVGHIHCSYMFMLHVHCTCYVQTSNSDKPGIVCTNLGYDLCAHNPRIVQRVVRSMYFRQS